MGMKHKRMNKRSGEKRKRKNVERDVWWDITL